MRLLKRIFASGLTVIIPLTITIYIFIALFYFVDNILGRFINDIFYARLGYRLPGLGIVFFILIVFLLGVLAEISRIRIFHWFAAKFEKFFFSLPLVEKIYSPVRQVVSFLFFSPTANFKKTVLVEYPRKGIYSLGFITNDSTIAFAQKGNKKYYNIFVPSSPSPLTGFTIIVEEREVIFLDIAVDKAIKMIISGGLLNPDGA